MGILFPLSAQRSPFLTTLFTFIAPVVYGAVAGAAVYLTAYGFFGPERWILVTAIVVLATSTYKDFHTFRIGFETGSTVTLREAVMLIPRNAIAMVPLLLLDALHIRFSQRGFPAQCQERGYVEAAQYIEKHPVFGAIAMTVFAATILRVFMNFKNSQPVRGRKVGTIDSLRELLVTQSRRRERRREDQILAQVHRDGGTSQIAKADLEFLQTRSRLPRSMRR